MLYWAAPERELVGVHSHSHLLTLGLPLGLFISQALYEGLSLMMKSIPGKTHHPQYHTDGRLSRSDRTFHGVLREFKG